MSNESLQGSGQGPVEQLLTGHNRLREMIATGRALPEILTTLVQFIESQVPGMICTILLLDEEGKRLWHGAAPSLPGGLIDAINGSSIGPSVGSCGTAAFRGENVFVEDIATDPLWEDYRNVFLLRGLRACWSSPIFDEQHRVLGTFAIYFKKPARPESMHLRLIELATHIAAVAITHNRRDDILRRSEQQLAVVYDSVSDAIFLLEIQADRRLRFLSVNNAFLQATGYQSEQIVGKFVDNLSPAPHAEVAFANFWKAVREKTPVEWEDISMYPAGRKKATIKVSPVLSTNGDCTNLVGVIRNWQDF